VIFLLFNLVHIKTLLDRCDPPFRIEFAFGMLSILLVLDLLARGSWQAAAWKRLACQTAAALVWFGMVVPQVGAFGGWRVSDLASRLARSAQRACDVRGVAQTFSACVRPTRDWHDLLEPSHDDAKASIEEGVRELRAILEALEIGDRQFLAVHSGPFLYPLVERKIPTQYYLLGWAMTEPMQRQAVEELQSHGVRAILRVNGLGRTLRTYDVPDEHRIPIVHQYLQAKIDRSTACELRLGTLYVEGVPPRRIAELRDSSVPR
jgi:hypothetical protein